MEGVVVPEGRREGARALDADVVVPESEGLEGVVVPREGGGQRGRALWSDVVLAEEELLCVLLFFGSGSEMRKSVRSLAVETSTNKSASHNVP